MMTPPSLPSAIKQSSKALVLVQRPSRFTVTLDKQVDTAVSVPWTLSNLSTEVADILSATSGTLNFTGSAGETKTSLFKSTETQLLKVMNNSR